MGYDTDFSLKIHGLDSEKCPTCGQDKRAVIAGELMREKLKYGTVEDLLVEGFLGVTWYEHEVDMRRISAKYPDFTFELEGEGEDNDDIWRKFFRDGKMQVIHAEVKFEEFDPTKLA